jgi:dihydrodipicolinate synthase/N-acetylneuraminate lyase
VTTATPGRIVCPLTTPLDKEECLDLGTLVRLVDHLLPDLDGILVLGSSGELPLLRPSVACEALEAVVESVGGRVPVYAGVGEAGLARTLENVSAVARSRADYVVATGPFYYPVTDQDSLVRHFLAIAEASSLPVFLYNIPQNTVSNLEPGSVERLAEHPNIAGIKDSSGDMFRFQGFLRSRHEGFLVMQGREQLAAASLWLGADGVISALANIAPTMLQGLAEAVADGNREAALEKQRRISDVARLFDEGYWLSALKAALAEMGFGTGRLAGPLPPCTEEQRLRIEGCLEEHGLLEARGGVPGHSTRPN